MGGMCRVSACGLGCLSLADLCSRTDEETECNLGMGTAQVTEWDVRGSPACVPKLSPSRRQGAQRVSPAL